MLRIPEIEEIMYRRTNSTMDSSIQQLHNLRPRSTFRSSTQHVYSPLSQGDMHLNETEPEKEPIQMGLILKAYDDCRQDTLALQVMHLLETIWESEGIDIPLMVYNVTPARTSDEHHAMGGIIECVQNSDSRDNLGKKGFVSLKMYYEVGPVFEMIEIVPIWSRR